MKIDVLAAVETVNFLTMQKTDWSAFRHCYCYCWMCSYNRYSFCLYMYWFSFVFFCSVQIPFRMNFSHRFTKIFQMKKSHSKSQNNFRFYSFYNNIMIAHNISILHTLVYKLSCLLLLLLLHERISPSSISIWHKHFQQHTKLFQFDFGGGKVLSIEVEQILKFWPLDGYTQIPSTQHSTKISFV